MAKKETGKKAFVYRYFHNATGHWNDVYEGGDMEALHLKLRMENVLARIDGLGLPEGARVLDLGCGAGLMTVELLRRQLRVDAFDISDNMLKAAEKNCREAGFLEGVSFVQGDAEELNFPDGQFDLVVSMGLIGYVPDWENVVQMVSHVIKPDGHIVLTFQAKYGLSYLLNPRMLRLGTIKNFVLRKSPSKRIPQEDRYSGRSFKGTLENHGFVIVSDCTIGFGPFWILGQTVIPEKLGIRTYINMQKLADSHRIPYLDRLGKTCIVTARRSGVDSKQLAAVKS